MGNTVHIYNQGKFITIAVLSRDYFHVLPYNQQYRTINCGRDITRYSAVMATTKPPDSLTYYYRLLSYIDLTNSSEAITTNYLWEPDTRNA